MSTASPDWIRVGSAAELAPGDVMAAEIRGESIAIYHLEDGTFHATGNICTHEFACLSNGWLEDGVIECPFHGGRFDVRTGKGLGPPIDKDLRTYPIKVTGDDLMIDAATLD
jgi:nitrite reductase/ring-hydroxylating ferredoxin subunit